jgi:short-subunit dehydrogenase
MQIKDSLCVVSGASSGIGRATARELAKRGARVILVARRRERLEEAAREIRANGGQAWAYPADLTRPQAAEDLGRAVLEAHGVPHVLVHGAGAGAWRFIEETSYPDFIEMMSTPYFSAAFLTRALVPAMLEENRGFVLSVCSPASRQVWPGAVGYIAARWALQGFTEALRADFYRTNLKAGCFFPSKISDSEYFIQNTHTEQRIPGVGRLIPAITSHQAALGIVRAIEREARIAFEPWQLGAFDLLQKVFPRISERLAWSSGAKRECRWP